MARLTDSTLSEISSLESSTTRSSDLPGMAEKEAGNALYKEGFYDLALTQFSKAIAIDGSNEVFYCNRSVCYAALGEWEKSLADGKKAISISPKYQKAHYRVVKALMEFKRYKDARSSLLYAQSQSGGQSKDGALKKLEEELVSITGIPVNPVPHDFQIVDQLGDGNFSKVFKTIYKPTKKEYAMKVIEKSTVEKMKRRHPNINNEIFMEKRVLNKLNHPNIVTLFSTFQDYGSLYFQMEYLPGGELWHSLQETLDESSKTEQIGTHWSLIRFYVAEILNGLEYMHQRGICHRDIKPENIMLTADGHVKFVDFGTAKDLMQTDLNGPNFVGTPEFMPPSSINSKPSGPEGDLWSFGVLIYQLFFGYTPFHAASPYLIFLRIKRGYLRIPTICPHSVASFIRLLLNVDGMKRLEAAIGMPPGERVEINYDPLRLHAFFTDDFFPTSSLKDQNNVSHLESFKNIHSQAAVRVPTLADLCIRAVGRACLILADEMAAAGGIRPKIRWMQTLDLHKNVSQSDRDRIAHYLLRRNKLHLPGVYRLFWTSVVDARSIRIDPSSHEYIGHTRNLQGQWDKDFSFVYVTDPLFETTSTSAEILRQTISAINKLRPRFVVIGGNLIHPSRGDSGDSTSLSYYNNIDNFRKAMARLSDTIPALYVPGINDFRTDPIAMVEADESFILTTHCLAEYRRRFGSDYYGFWYGGVRCLVVNSSLMFLSASIQLSNSSHQQYDNALADEVKAHDIWFEEEIEQAKLCSTHMLIFSHHPWFDTTSIDSSSSINCLPATVRDRWLHQLRHQKVKFIFCGKANANLSSKAFCNKQLKVDADTVASKEEQKNAGGDCNNIDERMDDKRDLQHAGTGSFEHLDPPLKPSEIIAAAKAAEAADASATSEGYEYPPAEDYSDTESESDEGEKEKAVADDGGEKKKQKTKNETTDSKGNDEDDEDDTEEKEFDNVHLDYDGPVLLSTVALGGKVREDADPLTVPGLRIITVSETKVKTKFYELTALPPKI